MNFLIFGIFILSVIEIRSTKETYMPNAKSNVLQIIENADDDKLPKFILLPSYQNGNETFAVEYKSIKKTTSVIFNSDWVLSVYVDQHFFYNNNSNELFHAMCFLQFSIENNGKDVGRNASCKITFRYSNITAVANCTIKIGRSPAICSAYFDLSDINFPKNQPSWGSITADLQFSVFDIVTTSVNSQAILINGKRPVNWTVVQESELFGKFALGLPLQSLKIGSNFQMPLSITHMEDLKSIRTLIEYDQCLSLNNVEITNKERWEAETNFEHLDNKESGVIRFTSRNQNRVEDAFISSPWNELAMINFTVTEKIQNKECRIRVGISRATQFSGESKKYFTRTNFKSSQNSVPVPIDPVNMVMIVFPQSHKTPMLPLFSGTVNQTSTEIRSYLLHKTGFQYLPQLIKTITCTYNKFSRGIRDQNCVPQQYSNSWVLPIQIEHWKTVIFNVFNDWQIHSWKLFLSDSELNPISDWRIPRQRRCIVMYQPALLKIGARLSTLNSIGFNTYLGSSLQDEKPWLDLSKDIDISLIQSNPLEVVSVSRNQKGRLLVTVNATRTTSLSLYNTKNQLLADIEVSVFSNHWASVVNFVGKCISDYDLNATDPHPTSEERFFNYEIKVPKLHIGEKCYLFLGVVFNDKTTLMLEDIDKNDYYLEVNGIEFQNGNVVAFRPQMNVILSESPICKEPRVIYNASVDLTEYWVLERVQPNIYKQSSLRVIGTSTTVTAKETTSAPVITKSTSISIAIYCVIGVVVMGLVILLLNCLVGFSVRRNSIANLQRRLSKNTNYERKNMRTEKLASQIPSQDIYPPLLPPPGPIVSPNKQPTDWGVSSESGIGLERSSVGSQQDPIALSTFRVSVANGSVHPSDSSSYIHQTPPFNDIILESNNMYTADQVSQSFDIPSCTNMSYWSSLNSPYRHLNNGNPVDFKAIHDPMSSKDHRGSNDLV